MKDGNRCAIAFEGDVLELPAEVYEAVKEFAAGKRSGRVTLDFRNGGVAGVELQRKLK